MRTATPIARRSLTMAILLGVLAAVPATADAARIRGNQYGVYYEADAGEVNDVTIVQNPDLKVTIVDAGVTTIRDGDGTGIIGCTTSGNSATCSVAPYFEAQLNDLGDTAAVGAHRVGLRILVNGSIGNDKLNGG